MQSVNSFRSELTSPFSAGIFNSTMTSSIQSTSPTADPFETDRYIATIRQLTEDNEDLKSQVDSLSQQLTEVNILIFVVKFRQNASVRNLER